MRKRIVVIIILILLLIVVLGYFLVGAEDLQAFASSDKSTAKVGEKIQFTGSATGGSFPYTYNWYFGDEQSSQEQNPTHSYSEEGMYFCELIVTDSRDRMTVAVVQISVYEDTLEFKVQVGANPRTVDVGEKVNFYATPIGGDAPYEYSWYFAGKGSSTDQNPTFTFYEEGTYNCAVSVEDSSGNIAEGSVNITVFPETEEPPDNGNGNGDTFIDWIVDIIYN